MNNFDDEPFSRELKELLKECWKNARERLKDWNEVIPKLESHTKGMCQISEKEKEDFDQRYRSLWPESDNNQPEVSVHEALRVTGTHLSIKNW